MSVLGAGPVQGTATVEDRGMSAALVTLQQMPSGKRYKGAGTDRVLLQYA